MVDYKEKYHDIIVNRKGISKDAFMTTTDILYETIPYLDYQVTKNGLELTNISKNKQEIKIQIPKYFEFTGKWLSDIEIKNELKDANILGGFSKFEIDLDEINIPIQDATIENLMYYNVKLLKMNDIITFETNDHLPLCIVNIGKTYINDYILQENYGCGVYLEYHKNPHFHMPINENSGGGIILAKKIEQDKYHISCFRIPYGYATYIPPYTIHNDCFLIGEYYVIYSKSEPFSTCLLRNKNDIIIKIKI